MIILLYMVLLAAAFIYKKRRKIRGNAAYVKQDITKKRRFNIQIIFMLIIFVFLLAASLISPYKYPGEPLLKQPNHEMADILFLIWSTALFITLLFLILAKPVKYKKLFYIVNSLFGLYSLGRLVSLFFIFGKSLFM